METIKVETLQKIDKYPIKSGFPLIFFFLFADLQAPNVFTVEGFDRRQKRMPWIKH